MASEAEGSAPDLRIVLLGVCGAGKSSIGNAILGREAFTESRTTESEIQRGRVEDRNISIIDTPGFFNTHLTDEELQKQMKKSLDLCAPGPHVFLLIVNLEKFIKDPRNIVLKILENFGRQALKFTMVVFTGREKMSNREWILFMQDSHFQKLVSQLINKYHEINSISEIKPTDITELLEKIEETVRHNKQHFSNNINLKFLIKRKYEEKNLAEVERTQVCEDTCSTVRRQYRNDEGDGVRQTVLRNSLIELGEQNTVNCQTQSGTGKWEQTKQQVVVEQQPNTADSAKHRHTKPAADLRIVMVGKTGAGKSATGNTILRRELFEEKLSVQSVTKECQQKQHTVGGRVISVIDTPGLCDTSISDDDLTKEIEKYVEMSLPGPHVFLLVIRVDVRLTDEEKNTVKWIQKNFGEDAAHYTIVLFTRGDQLNGSIKEFLDENKQMTELVEQCKGGYHVFSNKDEENPSQVEELLEKIDRMLEENGGQFYTNKMYETAQKKIKEEEERQRAKEKKLKSEETDKIRAEEKSKLMKDALTGAAVVGGTALVAATTGLGLPEALLSLAGDAVMASCGTALMTGAAALGGAALGAVTGGSSTKLIAAAAFPNIQVTLNVPQEPKKTDANDS